MGCGLKRQGHQGLRHPGCSNWLCKCNILEGKWTVKKKKNYKIKRKKLLGLGLDIFSAINAYVTGPTSYFPPIKSFFSIKQKVDPKKVNDM